MPVQSTRRPFVCSASLGITIYKEVLRLTPVFILTPVLKVLKHRVQLAVWVTLQVPVDADVAPVPNLFRQVCGVEDEFGLEEGVLAILRQETKIQGKVEVPHGLVDEPSVPCFISTLQHIHDTVTAKPICMQKWF